MAFHGHQRRYELAYPPLVRAQHPAMGDMLTRGRGSACWTEDGLEEAILAAGSRASLVFRWSRKGPGYHERPGRVYEHHQNSRQ